MKRSRAVVGLAVSALFGMSWPAAAFVPMVEHAPPEKVAEEGGCVFPIASTDGLWSAGVDLGTGSGPNFTYLAGIAVEAAGDISAADLARVLRVDPVTGDRTIVSDSGTGAGPNFVRLAGVAVEADGSLVVVDMAKPAVLRVDPVTGDRTIVSDAGTGAGPLPVTPSGIAVEASGDLVITDELCGTVMRVDPVKGDRVIVE